MTQVMLGIATISALAGWKQQQATLGSLDTHELSDKARSIELAYLTPPKTQHTFPLTVLPADETQPTGEPVPLSYEKPIDRPGVTAAFRAAAKVYLHTVVSGSFPNSDSVSKAVDEAIEVYRTVENADADRALVFALTITACVVRDDEQKGYIMERFKSLKEVGNCGQVRSFPLRLTSHVTRSAHLRCSVVRPCSWWRKCGDAARVRGRRTQSNGGQSPRRWVAPSFLPSLSVSVCHRFGISMFGLQSLLSVIPTDVY